MIHIPKTHSRLVSFLGMITVVVFGIVINLGSGGGGDGDSSTTIKPLVYDGNEDPAIITLDNATAIISNVLFGNMAGGAIPIAVSGSPTTESNESAIFVDDIARFFNKLPLDIISSSSINLPSSIELPICLNNGSASASGTLDQNYLGTVTITYDNCLLDNEIIYTGTAIVTFHAVFIDPVWGPIPTNVTMNFSPRMTIISANPDLVFSISATGGMTLQIVLAEDKETIRLDNLVTRDNNSGLMAWYVNFVITTVYDSLIDPFPSMVISQVFEGRAYHYTEGFVDVTTPGHLSYGDINLLFPDGGGPVLFVGGPPAPDANPTRIQLNVTDAVWIRLDLDIDGDGTNGFEITGCDLKWEDLLNPQPLVNCPPPE